jgi:hypothetical protein
MSDVKPISDAQLAEIDAHVAKSGVIHRISLHFEDYAGLRKRLRIAEDEVFQLKNCVFFQMEKLKLADALAGAAGNIPQQPSPVHRLMTPGWDQLNAAYKAYRAATSGEGK